MKIVVDGLSEMLASPAVPLRMGVPLPIGRVHALDRIELRAGQSQTLVQSQCRPLASWPDGSVKWCLLDWIYNASQHDLRVCLDGQTATRAAETPTRSKLLTSVTQDGGTIEIASDSGNARLRITAVDETGQRHVAQWNSIEPLTTGAIRSSLQAEFYFTGSGQLQPLQGLLMAEVVPDVSTVIVRVRLRNPQPAAHPNGNWDLGNAGSIYFKDLSLEIELGESVLGGHSAWTLDERSQSFNREFNLFQASSGGENWQSKNHLDRHRKVPMAFRGFKAQCDAQEFEGLRATPEVYLSGNHAMLGVAMQRFWENFPKAITATEKCVRLALWPHECDSMHELQGGEQKTHELACYLGPIRQRPLAWYVHGVTARLAPTQYAASQAIPYLVPESEDPHDDYCELVKLALEGHDTFQHKREKIDEYGWRNFGDVYGDHEAVHQTGPLPLISHYNNQYDCTQAFAIHFLRSGDKRWWDYMIQMADHAWDIDTYHTTGDKSLYNGGLFWHTYHYADADTGNHRSYPRSLSTSHIMPGGKDLGELGGTGKTLAASYAIGGGPSASQNYSTGWMLAYYLTGNAEYKTAAVNAADYVIRIEDGSTTIFRWLSRQDTGHSTESSPGYHGPGRASGNSLHALLTGFELTADDRYLQAAEQLIARVVHPEEDLEKLDLRNVELRWFYTMHLQAMMRYLEIKMSRGMNDFGYSYALASFRHYVRWMHNHERPSLSEPEKLQYPNETWAAQDLRKWNVLQWYAWHTEDATFAGQLQARADYFFGYVCDTLRASPTRALCRPVVLVLQFGWQRAWNGRFSGDSHQTLPAPAITQFLPRTPFAPQRRIAIQRAKLCVTTAVSLALITALVGCAWVLLH